MLAHSFSHLLRKMVVCILNIKQYQKNIKFRLSELFPALTHRNFRYFWVGQCISLIGTWMQNAGQSWVVMQTTNNAFLLGILNAVQFLPTLLFSLFAGVIVDRFSKRTITIIAQIVLMSCAFSLAILIWTHHANYIFILIIAFVLGIAQSIDMPARQSMMVELVGKEDLMNAIALNSAIFNGARIIGPALAGIVMANIGAGSAFFINGLSFFAVLYGLHKIDVSKIPVNLSSRKGVLPEALEGIKYIIKTPVLYLTIGISVVLCVFAQNFNTLIPALAKTVLHEKEMGYGFLMSAMGLGAFIGAVTLAMKSAKLPNYRSILIGGGVMSLFVLLTGFQHNYVLSAFLLMITGWGMILFNASANSMIQVNSPDAMRGRIMSAYILASGGMVPIGSLYAGYTAQKIGCSFAFQLSGIIGIAAVLLTTVFFKKMKPQEK